MLKRSLTWHGALLLVGLAGLGSPARAADAKAPSFQADVLPLFQKKCLMCHSGASPQAKLDLTSIPKLLSGGVTGAAILQGSADRSLLLSRVASRTMPPGKDKLSDAEIEMIRKWIDGGARESETVSAAKTPLGVNITDHDVLPIFQMRCVVCHGKRRQEGGLDLRTRETRLKGGRSGPLLVPGKPEESLLIKRVASGEMPPPKLLFDNSVRPPSNSEVETLRKWIAAGALPEPKTETVAFDPERDPLVKPSDRTFWSFQPPKRGTAPQVTAKDAVRTPVDAFLLAKLEAKGLGFAPEASRVTLLRRLYVDVTGMPPTPEEAREFLADTKPGAYERLVDRLLASPRYGERWGRYWLDAAGYSDSEGKVEEDRIRPQAWRYRDYVIRAFNSDMPYDRFLAEQIAGDEMVGWRGRKFVSPEELDKIVASGFLRMAADGTYSPPQSFLPERMNVIADEIEVLSTSVMGLTMGCARCHNHKYDPLPQRDYYRLGAVLQAAYDPYDWVDPTKRFLEVAVESEAQAAAAHNDPIERDIKRKQAELEEKAAPYREKILAERLSKLPTEARSELEAVIKTPEARRSEGQRYLADRFGETIRLPLDEVIRTSAEFKPEADRINREIRQLELKLKPKPHVRALYDMGGQPSASYVLRRGDALAPSDQVEPGVPSVLTAGLQPYEIRKPAADTTGRRLGLAKWITQKDHPLTARVMVNRIWMHHFGKGIVSTPSNFGRTGSPPSHPELLDWLAYEFAHGVDGGKPFSVKAIHKLILNSTAYRQSSTPPAETAAKDPENLLLSRMSVRRMDAEAVYDSTLRVTGRLDPTPYGAPDDLDIKPDGEVLAKPAKNGWRRSVYVLQRRRSPVTMLEVFDMPPMSPNCIERPQSTVATQALQMVNSSLVREHADFLAGRIIDGGGQPESWIREAYQRILSREASEGEVRDALASLRALTPEWEKHLKAKRDLAPVAATAQWRALGDLCHALLNSGGFVYVD